MAKSTGSPITIFLCEDSDTMRAGLRAIIRQMPEFEVIGEASDGESAVHSVLSMQPNVVLIDIGLPKLNGIEAARMIKTESPDTKTMMFTSHDDEEEVFQALTAGADGYMVKQKFNKDRLQQAIAALMNGACWLDADVARRVLKVAKAHGRSEVANALPLSTEEEKVLERAAGGTMDNCCGDVCAVDADFLDKLHRFARNK